MRQYATIRFDQVLSGASDRTTHQSILLVNGFGSRFHSGVPRRAIAWPLGCRDDLIDCPREIHGGWPGRAQPICGGPELGRERVAIARTERLHGYDESVGGGDADGRRAAHLQTADRGIDALE